MTSMILQEMMVVNPNIRKMFACTADIETICLLSKKHAKNFVEIGVDAEDYYRIKEK